MHNFLSEILQKCNKSAILRAIRRHACANLGHIQDRTHSKPFSTKPGIGINDMFKGNLKNNKS